jgi:uncharacterized membrane protein YgdD (TMEM256/DUF423 family)
MDPLFLIMGSLLGALGIAFGAFGAHHLHRKASRDLVATFEAAVRYQLFHALALLGVSIVSGQWPASIFPELAGWLFVAGCILFSGSLYLMVLTGYRRLGMVTPFGGIAFIAGWVFLALTPIL